MGSDDDAAVKAARAAPEGAQAGASDDTHEPSENKIDEGLMETFPASDPPSFASPVKLGGPSRAPSTRGRRSVGGKYRKQNAIKQDATKQSAIKRGAAMAQILSPGTSAPDFKLRVTPDQWLSLGDLKGRPVILAFYPADWSPVCGDQLAVYNEVLPEFRKHDAELLGISVDGAWCHEAFAKDRHLRFPLLADFHPKGEVAKKYGAYRESDGVCERAIFVIDRKGAIAWSYCSPIAVNPGADGILDALERLPPERTAYGKAQSASHAT
jgi:peroxiredoxin